MKYIIQDWMSNRIWPEQVFDSFEQGWDWIYTHDPEPDPTDPKWLDHWYDDYWVVPVECACESVTCSTHNLDQSREADLDLQIKQQTVGSVL